MVTRCGQMEYVVWGRRPQDEDWQEQLLKTSLPTRQEAQHWQARAEADGFVGVHIGVVDGSVPDFIGAMTRSTERTATRRSGDHENIM